VSANAIPGSTSHPESRPGWWKWAIALTASLGALLEIVDTSIVNVALRDMQATLGATLSEIGWVVTGYAIANVIIIPLSAWLGDYFGKKNYFIFSLIGFVLASMLCGFSNSLPVLIAARVLQGLTGGGLLAKAQSIIFETFPKEEQGMAQAIFGLGVIVGPAFGPTLGGFITDNIGWRWIFFINLPVGILAILAAIVFLNKDTHNPNLDRRIDWPGIFLLTTGLGALQVMLEEGQQDDWFDSPFIVAMAITSVIGLVLFIWQELTTQNPAVNLRVLRHRSLVAGSLLSMLLGMGLYGALFAIPIFAQSILNFTATNTGLLLLPGSLASGLTMLLVGRLAGRMDPRLMITVGSIIMSLTMFAFAQINPMSSADSLYWPLLWRGIGTVLMYLPLSLATFAPIPKADAPAATGFYNLTRQIGGSLGIAFLTTFLAQQENVHRSVLVEHVTPYNPIAQQQIQGMTAAFQQHGASLAVAQRQAYAAISGMIDIQAAIISYADIFHVVGFAFLLALPLLFLLGKGQPGKEAPSDLH
jgi:DHA2 family multidrug resistance protein